MDGMGEKRGMQRTKGTREDVAWKGRTRNRNGGTERRVEDVRFKPWKRQSKRCKRGQKRATKIANRMDELVPNECKKTAFVYDSTSRHHHAKSLHGKGGGHASC